MKTPTDKLFQDFWTIDGARFRASMVDSATSIAQNGSYPPRLMLVKTPTFIRPGDTIKNKLGEIFILLHYPNTQSGCRTFRAFQATESFTWKRRVDVVDSVSGMKKSSSITTVGTLYGTYRNLADDRFEGFEVARKSFWTGQDVTMEDLIDDCQVTKIELSMGAKLVTIR